MDLCAFDETAYSQWRDVGEYASGGGQHNTTLMNEYAGYRFDVPPVMPIEPAYIVPGPPPYNADQQTVPMVTPVSASTVSATVTLITTTAGATPRRTLTDDDRRRMCEYHESHPGIKQTEIGAMFGVERSTVSKVLRRKEEFLYSNDGSKSPTKKARSKFPDIERALANWAKNEQIKGEPLDHSKLQEQAQRFAVTVGNPERQLEFTSSAWLEEFKQKYNILGAKGHSNFRESDGIHVVDLNTTSFPETPNSYTPISSPSSKLTPPPTSSNQTLLALSHFTVEPDAFVKSEGQDESTPRMPDCSAATPVSDSAIEESLTAIDPRQMTRRNKSVPDIHSTRSTSMQPPPVPPLPRSENTSPVSSGSPTQDDARRALDLVWRYLRSQPASFLKGDEYVVVGKLMAKLSSSISERTAVLPGRIDTSLNSKKRKI